MSIAKRAGYSLAAALIAVASSDCASVHTTAQSQPGVVPRGYTHIAVIAATGDLRLKIAAESSFVRAGADAGVAILPGHALFLPGRALSDSELVQSLRNAGVQAVLLLTDATTAPPTTTTTAHAVPVCLTEVAGRCTQGFVAGSSSTRTKQNTFTVNSALIDVNEWQPVWVGSTQIERHGATDGALFRGLGNDVVATLMKSRELVIPGTP